MTYFIYTYDRVGNRTAKIDRDGVHNYTYDVLNRLIQATNPLPTNPLETYTYDAVGNRTNSNQNGSSIFNQANQLAEDANFTYQYDANGNLTRKTAKVGGAFTIYEYDAENKLVRVVTPGRTVNYKYDGLGRRVEKEIIEVTTTVRRYVYDNEDILLELGGSNNITARYTHGPGIDEPLVTEKSGASFFYHADGLGSITELTNAAGTVVQSYTYSSFGKIESQLDPNFVQPYTFTGREFDPETGLYYYRKRTLDPNTGRFNQQDPFEGFKFVPQTLNKYPYVLNSPLVFDDPDGRNPIVTGLVVLGAGYIVYSAVSAFRDWWSEVNRMSEIQSRINDALQRGNIPDFCRLTIERNEQVPNLGRSTLRLGLSVPGTSVTGPIPTTPTEVITSAAGSIVIDATLAASQPPKPQSPK